MAFRRRNPKTPEVPGIPKEKTDGMSAENKATLRGHQISINPTNELRYKRNMGRIRRLRLAKENKLENGVSPNSMEIKDLQREIKRCQLEIELYRLAVQSKQDGMDRLRTIE